MPESTEQVDLSQFDWVQLIKDMDSQAKTETRKEKLIRKLTENPFVPLGVIATTACLGVGLYSYRTGQRKLSQKMMRSRVAAQGFTVLALVLGIGLGISKK